MDRGISRAGLKGLSLTWLLHIWRCWQT